MTAPQKPLVQDLLRAAVEGDLARVRLLLEGGAETDADSTETAEVLRHAENDNVPGGKYRKGMLETLVLHEQHGRINAAMYLAAFNGFAPIVDYFLEKSAQDPLTLNVALFAALRAGRKELAETLLDAGADVHFKKNLPLRAAIDSGNMDCIQMLLARGSGREEGLAHACAHGNMAAATALLAREDDIRPALEKICHTLSDKRALPDKVQLTDVLSTTQMLLGLAEARGDDMSREIIWLAFTAVREQASGMVETIAEHSAFAALPAADKRQLFDVLTPLVFDSKNKSPLTDVVMAVDALGAAGGAQSILCEALRKRDAANVAEALRLGADPRRDHGFALHRAEEEVFKNADQNARLMLQDVRISVAALTAQDETRADKILQNPQDLAETLRRVETPRQVTGLMAVINAGRAEELAVQIGARKVQINADDVLTPDAHGYTAFDCLADRGQQAWIFTRALWQGQADEYMRLWQNLPAAWAAENKAQHEVFLNTLNVAAQHSALLDVAKRFDMKMPQRRKPPSPPEA